jgi:hypothetical protein
MTIAILPAEEGLAFTFSPYDLFWYWDPYYYRRRHRRDREMNFFEAVFSFVFGDGDPNLEFEKKRWELVGKAIQKNKGVVTAEQLAPYLDAAGYEDESFVLPALTRFEGTPEVNSGHRIDHISISKHGNDRETRFVFHAPVGE